MIDLILVLVLTMMMVMMFLNMMMTMTIMIDLILVLVLHISVKLWVASVPAIFHLNMVLSNHDDDDDDDVRIMRVGSCAWKISHACCQKLNNALAHPASSRNSYHNKSRHIMWSHLRVLRQPGLLVVAGGHGSEEAPIVDRHLQVRKKKSSEVRGAAACAQLWSTIAKMRAGWSSWSLLSFVATIRADQTNINGSLFHSLECSSFLNGCLATMAADQKFRLQSHFSFHSAAHQHQFAWRCHQ